MLSSRLKEVAKTALLPAWLAAGAVRGRPETLLILGHMRSGSSLLHHLLVSCRGVVGRGERNRVYLRPLDLTRLVVDVSMRWRLLPGARRIFVDQVNHTRFLPRADLLRRQPAVRAIYLLREPAGTLSSMLEIFAAAGWGPDRCVDYYVERLDALERLARSGPADRQVLVTYEALTGEGRPATLAELSRLLALPEPLQETYQVFPFTGRSGDPSERIRRGRIDARPRREPAIDHDTRRRADEAFARALRALATHCRVVE